MKTELDWKPITIRPERSGDVLIALQHHDVNMVVQGHYNKRNDQFTDLIYHGAGRTLYQFWAQVHHPEGDHFADM